MVDPLDELLELSHFLGTESRDLAILGEGNTSAKIDEESFLVKASGSCLETLGNDDVVACHFSKLLPMLDRDDLSDQDVEDHLLNCRVDPSSKKPSVETLFHAYLLTLPDVNFVGHTHSIAVNQILCSPHAEKFANNRLFPDEIVCCGSRSAFVPYTDPGLELSKSIRAQAESFLEEFGSAPRLILLANHGLITLGKTTGAVKAAMLMAHKAAEIFVGAAALGGPVFMSDHDVHRIANRIDEHYRQKGSKTMTTNHYVACDLGAESGRVMLGVITDGKLTLEEIHRFASTTVDLDGTMRWDIEATLSELKTGLRKLADRGVEPVSLSVDSWGVDYVWYAQDKQLIEMPLPLS